MIVHTCSHIQYATKSKLQKYPPFWIILHRELNHDLGEESMPTMHNPRAMQDYPIKQRLVKSTSNVLHCFYGNTSHILRNLNITLDVRMSCHGKIKRKSV